MPRCVSNLVGKSFNKLTVIEYLGQNKHDQHIWLCFCLCGKTTVLTTTRLTSKSNNTKSCGCLHLETIRVQQERSKTHGYTSSHKNLYNIYYGMLSRCYNPKNKDWKYYGAKGIQVLGWNSPKEFVEWGIEKGYYLGLTIDRINSAGDYTKENCEWVSREENTRRRHE